PAPARLRVSEGALDDAADIPDVLARGQLGDHAAPLAMDRHLGGDHIGSNRPGPGPLAGFFDDGGGGFVAGGFDAEDSEMFHARTPGSISNARFNDSMYGGRKMPRSVMMPAIRWCGVTSNAGFQTSAPSGAICEPPTWVTSFAFRSSIGMREPSGVCRSI